MKEKNKKCCNNCDFSYIRYDEYDNEKNLVCKDGGVEEKVNPSYVCDNFYNYKILMDELLEYENKRFVYTKKDIRK